MAVQLDPALGFRDPRLGRILDWWQARRTDLGHLPGRQHFDPLEIPALLPNIYLVDVVPPDRFRWRLIGSEITAMAGRNSTGRFFDALYDPATYGNFVASFRAVVQSRRPMRSFGDFAFTARGYVRFEALEVPLAEDGAHVDIVFGIAVSEPGEPTAG